MLYYLTKLTLDPTSVLREIIRDPTSEYYFWSNPKFRIQLEHAETFIYHNIYDDSHAFIIFIIICINAIIILNYQILLDNIKHNNWDTEVFIIRHNVFIYNIKQAI